MAEYVAYRCAAYRSPFWQDPNPRPGRFNRAGEAPTTYLGLHPLTPWAEVLRGTNRRTPDEVRALRPVSWAARVLADDDEVIDLSFENASDCGLSAEDLVSDDHGACQALASGLRGDPSAPKILIAPSAALPGTRTMILLGPRVGAPYVLEDNLDPQIDTSISPTAVLGSSLLGLVSQVHYRHSGVQHQGLADWQAGAPRDFTEPAVAIDEVNVAR